MTVCTQCEHLLSADIVSNSAACWLPPSAAGTQIPLCPFAWAESCSWLGSSSRTAQPGCVSEANPCSHQHLLASQWWIGTTLHSKFFFNLVALQWNMKGWQRLLWWKAAKESLQCAWWHGIGLHGCQGHCQNVCFWCLQWVRSLEMPNATLNVAQMVGHQLAISFVRTPPDLQLHLARHKSGWYASKLMNSCQIPWRSKHSKHIQIVALFQMQKCVHAPGHERTALWKTLQSQNSPRLEVTCRTFLSQVQQSRWSANQQCLWHEQPTQIKGLCSTEMDLWAWKLSGALWTCRKTLAAPLDEMNCKWTRSGGTQSRFSKHGRKQPCAHKQRPKCHFHAKSLHLTSTERCAQGVETDKAAMLFTQAERGCHNFKCFWQELVWNLIAWLKWQWGKFTQHMDQAEVQQSIAFGMVEMNATQEQLKIWSRCHIATLSSCFAVHLLIALHCNLVLLCCVPSWCCHPNSVLPFHALKMGNHLCFTGEMLRQCFKFHRSCTSAWSINQNVCGTENPLFDLFARNQCKPSCCTFVTCKHTCISAQMPNQTMHAPCVATFVEGSMTENENTHANCWLVIRTIWSSSSFARCLTKCLCSATCAVVCSPCRCTVTPPMSSHNNSAKVVSTPPQGFSDATLILVMQR